MNGKMMENNLEIVMDVGCEWDIARFHDQRLLFLDPRNESNSFVLSYIEPEPKINSDRAIFYWANKSPQKESGS